MLGFQAFYLAGVQGLEPWARGFGDTPISKLPYYFTTQSTICQ